MASQFHEEEINLGILYGTQGGPEFKTDITINSGGFEQSTAVWQNARGSWQLGNKTLTETEAAYLSRFFRSKLGRHIGFRFKDFSDYQLVDEPIGVGNGSITSYQLTKKYDALASPIEIRKITKVVGSTVVAKLNGVATTAFSINTTTGLVTFDSPPASGAIITITCEFRVPVRFNTDKLPLNFLAYEDETKRALFDLGNLEIVEIRI